MIRSFRALVFCCASLAQVLAFAQGSEECDSVLAFAGRDYKVTMTQEAYESYLKESKFSSRSSEGGLTVPIGNGVNIGGNAKQDDQKFTDSSNYISWRKELFQALDTVNEPAVNAWLACKNRRGIYYTTDHLDSDLLHLSAHASEGLKGMIQSITPDAGMNCIHNETGKSTKARTLNGRVNIKLSSSESYGITCKRENGQTGRLRVTFEDGTESSKTFIMPALPQQVHRPDLANAKKVLSLTGCDSWGRVASAPYPRQLLVTASGHVGGGTSGYYVVRVNDVVENEYHRGNPNSIGAAFDLLPQTTTTLVIPANFPVLVHATGGSEGFKKGCDALNVDVFE